MPNRTFTRTVAPPSSQPHQARRTLSVAETAVLLGLPELTVRRMAYRGELPSAKAGPRLLILRSGVERLLGERLGDGK